MPYCDIDDNDDIFDNDIDIDDIFDNDIDIDDIIKEIIEDNTFKFINCLSLISLQNHIIRV